MSNKTTICPKCLGAKEIMTPKKTRGFEYINCNLCEGTGEVDEQLNDDFIFAQNEENYDDDYESNNGW
jgi:RecJ-like exonuclease